MTSRHIELVRDSWARVAPMAEQAAAIFYENLFRLDPSVRPLFARTDMREQGKKLMQTLAVVVVTLDRLDSLLPAVEAMGRRHVGYGVEKHHYATVGNALLATFSEALGRDFTPAHRDAWVEAYGTLVEAMQQAAARAA